MSMRDLTRAAIGATAWLAAMALAAQAQLSERRTDQAPASVVRVLERAGIAPGAAALLVTDLETGATVAALEPDRSLNPASVMKVVTSLAALSILGPDYRWTTSVHAAGELRRGVLAGDLHFRGSGDPAFSAQALRELAQRLRKAGLREIRGDVVLDRSRFRLPPMDVERFLGEAENPYNSPPDALLLNLKTVRIDLVPDARTRTVRVMADPHPSQLELRGAVAWGDWGCDHARRDVSLHVVSTLDTALVRLGGGIPGRCGAQSVVVSLLGHPQYFYGTFRVLWSGLDGAQGGRVRDGPVPRGARQLDAWQSPRLADLLRDVNKHSNNLMTRQIFLALGAPSQSDVATLEGARAAVLRWLGEGRPDVAGFVAENGAGLSAIERASPRLVTRLLAEAFSGEHAGPFLASLAVAGVDGTLQRRLADTPVAGNALMKTGTLPEVRSIAGYVLSASGRWHAVVMLVNGPRAAEAVPAIDALVRWVYER